MDQIKLLGCNKSLLALKGDFPEILEGQRATIDHFVDGSSREKFHHHVRAVVINTGIKDGDDVRVLDRAKRGCFVQHGLGGLFLILISSLRQDAFDRNLAVQVAVEGPIYRTDATLPYLASDFIAISTHKSSLISFPKLLL